MKCKVKDKTNTRINLTIAGRMDIGRTRIINFVDSVPVKPTSTTSRLIIITGWIKTYIWLKTITFMTLTGVLTKMISTTKEVTNILS